MIYLINKYFYSLIVVCATLVVFAGFAPTASAELFTYETHEHCIAARDRAYALYDHVYANYPDTTLVIMGLEYDGVPATTTPQKENVPRNMFVAEENSCNRGYRTSLYLNDDYYEPFNNMASTTFKVSDPSDNALEQCSNKVQDGMARVCVDYNKDKDTVEECKALRQLAIDNAISTGKDDFGPCIRGKCSTVPNVCFEYRDYVVGDDKRMCATTMYYVDDDGNYDASKIAESLRECNKKRAYYMYEDQEVPECEPVRIAQSHFTVLDEYSMCFNPAGLRRLTQKEIDNIDEVIEERRIAEEKARRLKIFTSANSTLRSKTFGGIVGGLVPVCAREKETVGPGGHTDTVPAGCGWVELVQLANNVIQAVIWVAAFVFVVVMLLAGFKLVTAQGNVSALQDAKGMLFKALLGFIVVLFAWLMVSTVLKTFLKPELQNNDVVNLLEDN